MLRDAEQLVRTNKTDQALTELNSVLASDPKNLIALVLRGEVYSQKKMWDQARNDFETAHLLDPTNGIVSFNVAETKFSQKQYDAARTGFAEIAVRSDDIGDLSKYKVFLCDLLGGHADMAKKEFDEFNKVGSHASYYYANVAWDIVVNKNPDDARTWLISANTIYAPEKNNLFSKSLVDLGYLPLPPPTH
jgi:tetratricopeptide (TPR) repeat protein